MASCVVRGCSSKANHELGVSFHRFPQDDPEMLEKWVQLINKRNWQPKKSHVVCSKHFTPDSFKSGRGQRTSLKSDAVPTILPVVAWKRTASESIDLDNEDADPSTSSLSIKPAPKKRGRKPKASTVNAARKKGDTMSTSQTTSSESNLSSKIQNSQRKPRVQLMKLSDEDVPLSVAKMDDVIGIRNKIIQLEMENRKLLKEIKEEQVKNQRLQDRLEKLSAPGYSMPRIIIARIQY